MTAAGTVKPARVLIMGVGVAGLQACVLNVSFQSYSSGYLPYHSCCSNEVDSQSPIGC